MCIHAPGEQCWQSHPSVSDVWEEAAGLTPGSVGHKSISLWAFHWWCQGWWVQRASSRRSQTFTCLSHWVTLIFVIKLAQGLGKHHHHPLQPQSWWARQSAAWRGKCGVLMSQLGGRARSKAAKCFSLLGLISADFSLQNPPVIVSVEQNCYCCKEPAPSLSSTSVVTLSGGTKVWGKSAAPTECAEQDQTLVSVCWAKMYGITGNCCAADCRQST